MWHPGVHLGVVLGANLGVAWSREIDVHLGVHGAASARTSAPARIYLGRLKLKHPHEVLSIRSLVCSSLKSVTT